MRRVDAELGGITGRCSVARYDSKILVGHNFTCSKWRENEKLDPRSLKEVVQAGHRSMVLVIA